MDFMYAFKRGFYVFSLFWILCMSVVMLDTVRYRLIQKASAADLLVQFILAGVTSWFADNDGLALYPVLYMKCYFAFLVWKLDSSNSRIPLMVEQVGGNVAWCGCTFRQYSILPRKPPSSRLCAVRGRDVEAQSRCRRCCPGGDIHPAPMRDKLARTSLDAEMDQINLLLPSRIVTLCGLRLGLLVKCRQYSYPVTLYGRAQLAKGEDPRQYCKICSTVCYYVVFSDTVE